MLRQPCTALTMTIDTTARHYNTEQLNDGCAQLQLTLSDAQCEKLCAHLSLLTQWNRRINLTAVGADEMITRHVLDSLSAARFVDGDSLLDVGSGGGFPGLPLAVAMPHLQVTLLDSRAKRVEFLRHVRDVLQLANVQVVHSRIEHYRAAQKFDTLISRAFAPLGAMLTATASVHNRIGRLLAMKGKAPQEEIAALCDNQRRALAGRIAVERIRVPFLPAERHLIVVDFNSSTQHQPCA